MSDYESPQSKGGKARVDATTAEERSEIGRKGGNARWDKTLPTVLLGGNLVLGGVEVDCYVTEDGERLIAGRGMQDVLKLVDIESPSKQKSGSRMTRLLNNEKLKPMIYKDKSLGHFEPKKCRFQGRLIAGHNAEMLIDICEGMLEARNSKDINLTARQELIAAQCELILRGLAKTGIVALIDEATGYQNFRPADSLRTYFDIILRKDLAVWVKRFPDEYYENIYKLKGWDWQGMSKNRFSVVGKYTNDLLYGRIIPGLTEEFEKRNPKNIKGVRKHKHHQMLNDDAGDKLFSAQMFTILALQRACLNKAGNKWNHFISMMDDILPKKGGTIPMFPHYDPANEQ